MLVFSSRPDQITRQLRDRLKTTGVGLGLLRLQLDAGMTEEARTTLSSLQDDFQLPLHGVEEETEKPPAKPYAGLTGDRWFRKPFDPSVLKDLTKDMGVVCSRP